MTTPVDTDSKRFFDENSSLFIEAANALIVITDQDLKIIECNKLARELLGKEHDELIKKDYTELFLLVREQTQFRKQYNLLVKGMQNTVASDDSLFESVTGEKRVISWRRSVLQVQGTEPVVIHFGLDITERRKTEEELKYRVHLESIINEISTNLINLKTSKIDSYVSKALSRVGKFTNVDSIGVYTYNEQSDSFQLAYVWNENDDSQDAKVINREQMPWVFEQIMQKNTITVDNCDDCEPERLHQLNSLSKTPELSFLIVPLVTAGKTVGLIKSATRAEEKVWTEEVVTMTRLVSQILVNSISRKNFETKLQARNNELERLNKLMVNRELRMVELKNELKNIKSEKENS